MVGLLFANLYHLNPLDVGTLYWRSVSLLSYSFYSIFYMESSTPSLPTKLSFFFQSSKSASLTPLSFHSAIKMQIQLISCFYRKEQALFFVAGHLWQHTCVAFLTSRVIASAFGVRLFGFSGSAFFKKIRQYCLNSYLLGSPAKTRS